MSDNFKIICKIGQGGFGNVFLVNNSRNEKLVIKSVSFSKFTKYAINEFEILKRLDHPRIIKLIDFFPSHRDYNFVLEYAENGSLRQLINKYQEQRWKMSSNDLGAIFMEIAYGVRFLHSQNIIHRDIKPENILLVRDYRAKLADFGISKIVMDCAPETHTSIGTLCYMSPEVYLQKPYDKSCDVWALGLIFYELAMMKYPFDKVDKSRILNPLLTFECPRIDWSYRKYDPRYQEILEMMLQRDPTKRKSVNTICHHSSFTNEFKKLELETEIYCLGQMRNSKIISSTKLY